MRIIDAEASWLRGFPRAFDIDRSIAFYEQAFGVRLMFRWLGRHHHDALKAKAPFERSFVARAAHVRGPNGEIIERFES